MTTDPLANYGWKERVSALFAKFFGRERHPSQSAIKVDQAIQFHLPLDLQASREEKEMLQMKAISLLQKDHNLLPYLPQLLQAPIKVNVEEATNQKLVIILTQQLIKEDGKKVILQGRFTRTPKTKYSIPLGIGIIPE